MAPKPQIPLTKADLAQFVSQEANFAFEMEALRIVRDAGFDAEHAATYRDPLSGKIRAFDVRARWRKDAISVRFAVECKNLRAHAPLLVHATPRTSQDAGHSVIVRYRTASFFAQDVAKLDSVYPVFEPVGRQTDQPIKDSSGDFKSPDSESYDKWMQAVSGCQDLLREAVTAPLSRPHVCAIVPMLVVPDGRLWQVDYDDRGKITKRVRQATHSSLVLRQSFTAETSFMPVQYPISHIELVTLGALRDRLKFLVGPKGLCSDATALIASRAR